MDYHLYYELMFLTTHLCSAPQVTQQDVYIINIIKILLDNKPACLEVSTFSL